MVLAACSYMLRPLVAALRKEGIPFHNPYRKANGTWNPLRLGTKGSTPNRILSLLVAHPEYGDDYRRWTGADLAAWAEWLPAKDSPEAAATLRHGMKARLATIPSDEIITHERLREVFLPGAFASLMEAYEAGAAALLMWWVRRLNADSRKRAEYPVRLAIKGGCHSLYTKPLVTVGTIHSVKGGESDVVILFPDLSAAGAHDYDEGTGPGADAVVRQFYVGATRAREMLYICSANGTGKVRI
jgi:DNA helicase II / ATP-dependent DNA helicase PcrA